MRLLPVLFICMLAVSGCGGGVDRPAVYKAGGVIKFKGNPVADATVTFYPEKGRPATGQTNAQGEFQLTTFNTNDGATAGTHKVAIVSKQAVAVESNSGPELEKLAKAEASVPGKYANPETTPQVNTVVEGDNRFDIELTD